jgi:Shedu protein SduA, C-terminal
MSEQIIHDLIYKVGNHYAPDRQATEVKTVVVHPGPRAWKTVSLLRFLNTETGKFRGPELRAQTWRALSPGQGGTYDFNQTEYHWHCEGEDEIEALRLFLNDEFPAPGKYRLIKKGSEFGRLVGELERGDVTTSDVARLIQLAGRTPDLVKALAASQSGGLLAEAVELQRRRDQLAELRSIVENPTSNERAHIHPQLKGMGWIFGGRYVGESTRHQLTTGDVLDIPLLRADGSLHVVELKRANIPSLVRQYRGPADPQVVAGRREELPLIVGTEVHEAVGQAMNYLCHLDEDRDHILAKFKIDVRRASATVLIGHPSFVPKSFTPDEIASTLRIHNSHHARITVMHYGDLIESAERALALADTPLDDPEPDIEANDDAFTSAAPMNEFDPWMEVDESQDSFSDEPPF